MSLQQDLELALALSAAAAEVALPLFHRGVATRDKADGSPVTEADLAVEARLLQLLRAQRPADAIVSEECGAVGAAARRWILDPIDGTRWFAGGELSWGTHVALEQDGEIVLGVVSRPASGGCYWAARGLGAYRGPLDGQADSAAAERMQVSDRREIADSRVMVWAKPDDRRHDLLRSHAQQRDPTIDGVLEVAGGTLEAIVDTQGELWDMAPAVVIVEEAGGRFSDVDGGRVVDRRGGWFTNGRVDAGLRRLLARE